ncbi:MAG: hypothetical protein HYX48_00855 [Chlamydiales bacterium]|nr:hypothetical protein [Chlamydiales bacterium]
MTVKTVEPNLLTRRLSKNLIEEVLGYLDHWDVKVATTCKAFSYLNCMELMKKWQRADLSLLSRSLVHLSQEPTERAKRACQLLALNGGNLTSLNMNDSSLEGGASYLLFRENAFPRLTHVRVEKRTTSVAEHISSKSCPKLTSLTVADKDCSSTGIARTLNRVPTLQKLELPSVKFNAKACARTMNAHPALNAVHLVVDNDQEIEDALSIAPLAGVRTTTVGATGVGIEKLAKAATRSLRELTLNACCQISSAEGPISTLKLTSFAVQCCSPWIRFVDRCVCQKVPIQGKEQLGNGRFFSSFFPTAVTLHSVAFSGLKDPALGPGLEALHTLPLLTRLTISECSVSAKALQALGRCTQLNSLKFTDNVSKCSPKEIKEIREMLASNLQNCNALEELEIYDRPGFSFLSYNFCIDEWIAEVASHLKRLKLLIVGERLTADLEQIRQRVAEKAQRTNITIRRSL